jgi:Mg2+ and Co2+ transporter CorA
MLRTLLRDEAKQFRVVEDPEAISDIVEHAGRLLWLDLENPTDAELALVQEEFNLHPLAMEDARASHQRPKIEEYGEFYLVVFYSVAVEEVGSEGTLQGRRGLRGSTFHRPGSEEVAGYDGAIGEIPGTGTAPALPTEGALPGAGNVSFERIVLREITLFLGANYLITVHTHPVPELEDAAQRWRRNAEMIAAEQAVKPDDSPVPGTRRLTPQPGNTPRGKAGRPGSAGNGQDGGVETETGGQAAHSDDIGILFYSLLDSIVDNYFPVIDSVVDRVEDIEAQIFERFEPRAIEGIFTLKKDLLALRKVLAPERDVMNVLIRRDLPIFDQHTVVYFQDVYDHVVRITDSIDAYRDLLSSALDSYLSMQSNRLNITVQTLTSWSIILMSVAGIAGWYGMNFQQMPELSSPYGYPAVIAFAVLVVALEFAFFRRKGWL